MGYNKVFGVIFCLSFSIYSMGAVSLNKAAISCFECDGQQCLRTSYENTTESCQSEVGCYAIFNGYTPVKKGCYNKLTNEEKLICDSDDDVTCYKCDTDKCNILGRFDHVCVQCSSAEYEGCKDKPAPSSVKRCNAPKTDNVYCYVKEDEDVTVRGCLNTSREILDCTNDENCDLCLVNKYGACNVDEFGPEPGSANLALPSMLILLVSIVYSTLS